jgi:hypothetical protein
MRRKPLPKQDPEQLERFKQMAREVEVDESPEAFERAFNKVVRSKTNRQQDIGSAGKRAKP